MSTDEPGALTGRERAILQLIILIFDVLDREGLQPLDETWIAIGGEAGCATDPEHRRVLLMVRAALMRLQDQGRPPPGPELTVIEGGRES